MRVVASVERASVTLGPRERAVLAVLTVHSGRIVYRDELRREAGLDELDPRRCEALLVGIRRVLGPDAIVTVRRRGWMLAAHVFPVAAAIVSSGVGA